MKTLAEMTTDELIMAIGRPGVSAEIEQRRQRRLRLDEGIAQRELHAARSRVAGR